MDAENSGWQPPPIPEKIKADQEQPQMSEAATLGGIFFEPGKTFEDLRRKPRFLLAGLLIIIAFSVFNVLVIEKVGLDRITRARIESSSSASQMPSDQKEKMIEQQSGPIARYIGYAATPIVMLIVLLLGGLVYWLGANAMGGSANFGHGLSVWIYSWLPPTILFVIANVIVLLLKSVDEIDPLRAQTGVLQAIPSMFIDAKAMPVIAALLSAVDLFRIWGWILAAIGLQKTAKISSGAAWGVVLFLGLIGVLLQVLGAVLFG